MGARRATNVTRVLAVWPAERWLGWVDRGGEGPAALEVRGSGSAPSADDLAWADVVVAVAGLDGPDPAELGGTRVLWLVPEGAPARWWPRRPGTASMVAVTAGPARLAAAIVAAAEGLWVWDAAASADDTDGGDGGATAEPEVLTPREREILELVSVGLSNRAIADRLALSEHTVKSHVRAVLGKLGAESRTEAVALAARRGWVSL